MTWNPLRARREREEREFAELEEFRFVRKLAHEDVTVFGEQLTELHVDTMTTVLDEDMRRDYQRALDLYEEAKASLHAATTKGAVTAVDPVLDDGRFHLACVLARRDGEELPTRRGPCFFNPQHGPGAVDVAWTPPHGVERLITVCRSDANRMAAGEEPDVRLVRVGDRYVAWHTAGGSLSSVADHRAHVVGGGDTRLTDKHVAEAHTRAGMSGPNSMGGRGGR